MLHEHGWLLPLRTPGVWEFTPGTRAGALRGGDPFIELRGRLATRPIEVAVAAEPAAWLHGLSTRAPEPHVLAFPSGANVPKSLDEFRAVHWSAVKPADDNDDLPVWSVATPIACLGARTDRYRDWPNVSDWLADAARRVPTGPLLLEPDGQPRSAWARTSYLLSLGGRDDVADELFGSAPVGSGPSHLGPRNMPSKYSARFEVIDHVLATWWSIKATSLRRAARSWCHR